MRKWSQYPLVDRVAIGALLVAALVEIISLVRLPVQGYDTPNHLYWIESWHALWQQGIYYPRWLPNSFGGFGAPSFYFYPPLTYVVTSLLYALLPAASLLSIGKLFFVLTLAGSGITMWWYLRSRGFSTRSSSLGAMLYLFAPYRFLDFNTRTAFSEHFAFVFLPLAFWAADRWIEGKQVWRASAVLLLALVLLILTSLPSAATMFLGLVVYALAGTGRRAARNLGWLATLCAVAALLTAFYLLPIVLFYRDVHLGIIWDTSSIGTGNAVLALFQGVGLRINLYNGISFLGAVVLLFFWWRMKAEVGYDSRNASNVRQGWLLAMIVALQLPYIPLPLFYYIPPFKMVQLPPRLSLLVVVVLASAWAARLDRPNNSLSSGSSWVVAGWSIAAACLVAGQVAGFQVHKHYTLGRGDAPEYVTRWSPHYRSEFSGFQAGFRDTSQRLILSSPTGIVLHSQSAPYSDRITYRSSERGLAIIHRLYWPAWSVRIDENLVATRPDSLGRLSFLAPAGTHTVSARLETPAAATLGTWCSLLTFSLLGLTPILFFRRKRRATR